jgi:hypothetical protein
MVQDLSFIHENLNEEEEERVRKAVEEQCFLAVINYLTEVADTMEQNSLECLSPVALRAMAETLQQRLETNDEPAN